MVLGAIICNVMFWKLNKMPLEHSFTVVVILGFSVWIIYVLDRLLDNNKIDSAPTERHIFHQQNAEILWFFIGMLALFCAVLIFYLPKNIIIFGIVISLLTGIYLLIISKISSKNDLQRFKEPVTAFVYVLAVFGTTILHNPQISSLLIGFIFLLIVFQNLLFFSLSEFKKNIDSYNLAEYFGINKSNLIIIAITFTITILGFYSIYSSVSNYDNKVVFVEIIMSFILLIMNQFDTFFIKNDRYRWVGDGIFLLPLSIIL